MPSLRKIEFFVCMYAFVCVYVREKNSDKGGKVSGVFGDNWVDRQQLQLNIISTMLAANQILSLWILLAFIRHTDFYFSQTNVELSSFLSIYSFLVLLSDRENESINQVCVKKFSFLSNSHKPSQLGYAMQRTSRCYTVGQIAGRTDSYFSKEN